MSGLCPATIEDGSNPGEYFYNAAFCRLMTQKEIRMGRCLSVLLLQGDSRRRQLLDKKALTWRLAYSQRVHPRSSWQKVNTHGAKSLHLDPKAVGKVRKTRLGVDFWNLEALFQWCTFSNRTTPPYPSQQFPSWETSMWQYRRLWGHSHSTLHRRRTGL